MKKELRPFHDQISCEVCGRTILKGERTESYLAPGGHRHVVCELCFVRAEHAGWIRESAADQLPARGTRLEARRPLLGRLRKRREPGEDEPGSPLEAPAGAESPFEDPSSNGEPQRPERRRDGPQDPRHVRGVPTTAEVKVERGLDLFNASEHARTVSGLARTLGFPWASATPDPQAPSAIVVVVAWELSWYRYRCDLGDAAEPVALVGKGDEVEDLEPALREWNAGLDDSGRLVIGVASE